MATEFVPFKYVYLPMAAAIGFLYLLSYLRSRRATMFLVMLFGCLIASLTAFSFLSEDAMKIGIIVACTGLLTVLICIEPYIGLLGFVIFVYIRPQELDPSLRTLRLVSIIGSWALLTWLLTVVARRGNLRLSSGPSDGMLLGIYLIMIASSIFNRTGMTGDVAKEFLSNVLIYFVIIGSVTSVRRFEGIIWLLLGLGLVLSVQGFVQYYTGVGLGGTTMIQGRIRALGIFHDPNDLAQALVMLLPFLVVYLLERPLISRKLLCLAITGVFLYALYLTNSRGGMVSLAAAGAVYCWRRYGKVAGGVLMILVIAAIVVLGPSRMGEMSADESSASDRLSAWRAGLWMMRINPFLGLGPNMFAEYHGLVAHNSFMHGIVEIGFIGIFLWLGMIYMAFRYLHFVRTSTTQWLSSTPVNELATQRVGESRSLRRQDSMAPCSVMDTPQSDVLPFLYSLNGFAVALEVSIVGYLVAAFFLSRTYNIVLYMLLALSVALYLITSRLTGESIQRHFGVYDVLIVGAIQIGLILLVYSLLRVL